MIRTALQPRWLALLALVLALCAAFGWLGSWQLGVARDKGAEAAARQTRARPAAPLDQVLRPQQPFPTAADARAVTVGGRYDPGRGVLVGGRLQGGRSGWWVVGALRTDAGAWLPVVRGWVASPQQPSASASAVPPGQVSLTGVLQPDDAPATDPTTLPAGELAQVAAAELVNRWGGPIYNGYLLMTGEQPRAASALPEPVRLAPYVPQQFAWRNAAYAVQWWVFAGFALLLWWRMVRQDQLDQSAGRVGVERKVSIG